MTPGRLRLDDRAVEAAARQRFHEAMRGDKDWTWASVTEDTREAYREAERRARAAYFAALDPEARRMAAIEQLGRVRNDTNDCACDGCLVDAVIAALGLFIPDTEPCSNCDGRGRYEAWPHTTCPTCGGTGLTPDTEEPT